MTDCATGVLIDLCSPTDGPSLPSHQIFPHSHCLTNQNPYVIIDDCFSLVHQNKSKNEEISSSITSTPHKNSPVCDILVDISSQDDVMSPSLLKVSARNLKKNEENIKIFSENLSSHGQDSKNVMSPFMKVNKFSPPGVKKDGSSTSSSKKSWSPSAIFTDADLLENETFDFNISLSPYRAEDEVFHIQKQTGNTFITKDGQKIPLSSEQMEEIQREASSLAHFLSQPQKSVSSSGNSDLNCSLRNDALSSLTNLSLLDVKKMPLILPISEDQGLVHCNEAVKRSSVPQSTKEGMHLTLNSKICKESVPLIQNSSDYLEDKENLSPNSITCHKAAVDCEIKTSETPIKTPVSMTGQHNSPNIHHEVFTLTNSKLMLKDKYQATKTPNQNIKEEKNRQKRSASAGEIETSSTSKSKSRLSTLGNIRTPNAPQKKLSEKLNATSAKVPFCSPKVTSSGLKAPGSALKRECNNSSSSSICSLTSTSSFSSTGKSKFSLSVDSRISHSGYINSLRLSNRNSSTSSSTKSVGENYKKVMGTKNIGKTPENSKCNTQKTGPLKATAPMSQMTKLQCGIKASPGIHRRSLNQGLNMSLPNLPRSSQSCVSNPFIAPTPTRKYGNISMLTPAKKNGPSSVLTPSSTSTPSNLRLSSKMSSHSTPLSQTKELKSRRLSALPTPIRRVCKK